MFKFDKIPPEQFTLIAALLGVVLNREMDINEQNAFGNFLVSVGQTMLTAAAQGANQEAHPAKNVVHDQIDKISSQLDELKKQLKYKC